jgi:DNA-binding response OmpR family regulator
MASVRSLVGRSILVIEDEPLIALDVGECFRRAGAFVLAAFNLRDGLRLAGDADLSAAVVDLKLTRFRGHPKICVEGVHDAKQGKEASTIPA